MQFFAVFGRLRLLGAGVKSVAMFVERLLCAPSANNIGAMATRKKEKPKLDPLATLFGSVARVRLLRLFLLNPEKVFTAAEIQKRCKLAPEVLKKEITQLEAVSVCTKEEAEVSDEKGKLHKETYLRFDESFPVARSMRGLLIDPQLFDAKEISKRFETVGRVKLFILSGIFLQREDSRVDMFLVVDNIKRNNFEKALKQLEAELGRELNYGLFTLKDFEYRLSMFDKFVRDVLDYPHETVINKLEMLL